MYFQNLFVDRFSRSKVDNLVSYLVISNLISNQELKQIYDFLQIFFEYSKELDKNLKAISNIQAKKIIGKNSKLSMQYHRYLMKNKLKFDELTIKKFFEKKKIKLQYFDHKVFLFFLFFFLTNDFLHQNNKFENRREFNLATRKIIAFLIVEVFARDKTKRVVPFFKNVNYKIYASIRKNIFKLFCVKSSRKFFLTDRVSQFYFRQVLHLSKLDNHFFQRAELLMTEVLHLNHLLEKDPSGIYLDQEASTKKHYCDRLYYFSRIFHIHEFDLAKNIVYLAERERKKKSILLKTHVGFFLEHDEGVNILIRLYKDKMSSRDLWYERFKIFYKEHSFTIYLSVLFFFYLVFVGVYFSLSRPYGTPAHRMILLFFLSPVIFQTVMNVFSGLTEEFLNNHYFFVPSLNRKTAVSSTERTIMVVPSFFREGSAVERLFSVFEENIKNNLTKNIHFALLLDFKDSKSQKIKDKEKFIQEHLERVKSLNRKYSKNEERIHLFWRENLWNEKEGVFMGWERKRGKLLEFMRALRGERNTSFSDLSKKMLINLPYFSSIFVLDEDGRLLHGTLPRVIKVANHPLMKCSAEHNQKYGYGIITLDYFSNNFSEKNRIVEAAAEGLLNPLAYLDRFFFDHNVYLGKGLIDIDEYLLRLADYFPINKILTHDVIEGIVIRSKSISEKLLIDDVFFSIDNLLIAKERWHRGDWQTLFWVLLNKKKMKLDDFFQLLSSIGKDFFFTSSAVLVLFFVAITKNRFFLLVLCIVLTSLVISPAFYFFSNILSMIRVVKQSHYLLVSERVKIFLYYWLELAKREINSFFAFLFVYYLFVVSQLAFFKSYYRYFFSRKKLLEWTPFVDQVEKKAPIYLFLRLFPIILLIPFISDNRYILIIWTCWFVWPFIITQLDQMRAKNQKHFKI